MANTLDIEKGSAETLGGGSLVKGMQPYAQRYGGHQFGNWAHQLGDGRAITLGEVKLADEVLELQLKKELEKPLIPDLLMEKQSSDPRSGNSCVAKQCFTQEFLLLGHFLSDNRRNGGSRYAV